MKRIEERIKNSYKKKKEKESNRRGIRIVRKKEKIFFFLDGEK